MNKPKEISSMSNVYDRIDNMHYSIRIKKKIEELMTTKNDILSLISNSNESDEHDSDNDLEGLKILYNKLNKFYKEFESEYNKHKNKSIEWRPECLNLN